MRFNPTFTATLSIDIEQSNDTLQTDMQQLSTGQRVNQPSDDPSASAAMVQSLSESAADDQYSANSSSVLSQAQLADSALSSVTTLLNQAITLGTEGANGTEYASDQTSIADQVQGLLTNLVSVANTTYQGVAIFGGTSGVSQAFTANSSGTAYTYEGNSDTNYVAVGQSLSVQANVSGDEVFTKSGSSAIGSLEQLISALQGGSSAAIGNATAAVSTALNYVSQQHAVYGNTINQLTSQESFLSQEQVTLTSQQSSLVGIDTSTAIEDLTEAETQNSAILAAAAKVIPESLLNYLPN